MSAEEKQALYAGGPPPLSSTRLVPPDRNPEEDAYDHLPPHRAPLETPSPEPRQPKEHTYQTPPRLRRAASFSDIQVSFPLDRPNQGEAPVDPDDEYLYLAERAEEYQSPWRPSPPPPRPLPPPPPPE